MFPRRPVWRRVAALVLLLATSVAVPTVAVRGAVPAAAWAPAGALPGLGGGHVWGLALDPAKPTTVLAATDVGVYRSPDGGGTWALTAFAGQRAWAVAFPRGSAHVAYAGLDGAGVARSGDGGATWAAVSKGLSSPSVRAIAFAGSLVVAGTGSGVSLSADGATWRAAGLPGYSISALGVTYQPQASGPPQPVILAGTDTGPGGQKGNYLFANAGPGPAWKTLSLPADTATVNAIAVGPAPATTQRSAVLTATDVGVYRSDDPYNPNAAWTRVFPAQGAADQNATLTTVASSPIDPNLVYAGDDAGGSSGGDLLRSTDGGITFNPFDSGLSGGQRNVAAIAVAASSPPLVVAAIDPAGRGGQVYAQTDATAPPPAATAPPPVPNVAATVGPLPTFTPPPAPPSEAPPPAEDTGFAGQVLGWPFPLALELFVLLGAGYAASRWWQRRLDVEGPP